MGALTPSLALDDAALAWLGLALVVELTPRRAFKLVERFGTPDAVLDATLSALERADVPAETAAAIREGRARARTELASLARAGARVVAWSDEAYPRQLREIPDPPLVLAVRGTLVDDEPAVAVVGTRQASEYGRRIAAEIASGLAGVGVTVVSGLASGIDGTAHQAALAAGGRTVAVFGTGIDRVYPRWHRELAESIVGQGALVSEFPCGAEPMKFHFPRRNRVISGLALGTVVVEAAEESGSLITAKFAVEQNRDVFAVPGPADAPRHRGPNRLIREGARLITCAKDVLEELLPALAPRLVERRAAAAEASLTPSERRVFEAVGPDGGHVDEVIRRTAAPAPAVLETLLALELRGLVHQLPGKRFRRRAA